MAATTRAQRGFPRFFSTASFILRPRPSLSSTSANPAPAEPNTNLFVSGLSKRTTTEKLREAFSHFGDVLHARVVTDRVSGYSKGFGFVKYATLEDATKGIEGMHGKFLDGWVIFAEYARPRPPASQAQINGYWILNRFARSCPLPPNLCNVVFAEDAGSTRIGYVKARTADNENCCFPISSSVEIVRTWFEEGNDGRPPVCCLPSCGSNCRSMFIDYAMSESDFTVDISLAVVATLWLRESSYTL